MACCGGPNKPDDDPNCVECKYEDEFNNLKKEQRRKSRKTKRKRRKTQRKSVSKKSKRKTQKVKKTRKRSRKRSRKNLSGGMFKCVGRECKSKSEERDQSIINDNVEGPIGVAMPVRAHEGDTFDRRLDQAFRFYPVTEQYERGRRLGPVGYGQLVRDQEEGVVLLPQEAVTVELNDGRVLNHEELEDARRNLSPEEFKKLIEPTDRGIGPPPRPDIPDRPSNF